MQLQPLPPGAAPAGLEVHPPSAGAPGLIKEEPGTLIWREALPDGADAAIKVYRRRSALASLFRGRRSPYRAQREYETLAALERAGLDCTPPLFWAQGTDPRQGRFDLLATRWVPELVPLRELAAAEPETVRALPLERLYRMIREVHRLGIRHGALTPKNVLVAGRGDNARFLLVDLSRAMRFPRDLFGTRMAWFDLADLSARLAGLHGEAFCRPLLESYGLAGAECERLLRRLPRHRATRHTRNRLRLEFALRALWARATTPPPQEKRP